MTRGIVSFRRIVWAHYKKGGRHDLPWRKTRDPYKILVSEMMLQQTQVSRVIPKYTSFLKKFPTARALARASLPEVLREWSGLGYNRRAKYLHDTAREIIMIYHNNFRSALEHPLPGVGPYTKAAVETFAFNMPNALVETNIRTVFIHHFFPHTQQIPDREITVYARKAAEGQDPRRWHWALMDYGAYLKQTGVRNNEKSKHYTKQSKFKGSLREVRGAILKAQHAGKSLEALKFPKAKIKTALASLKRDGLT